MKLVLASASPRRAEILTTLGISHVVVPARVDERVHPGELPEDHALRLARAKAGAVASLRPDRWVLAGDTVVTLGGRILGKPRDGSHAVEMLLELRGRDHRVVSALALARPQGAGNGADGRGLISGTGSTRVRFRSFDRTWAAAYVGTGEPMGKAGGYAIQGRGAVLVEEVEGDYSGVVGLPVALLVRLLEEAGRPYVFD